MTDERDFDDVTAVILAGGKGRRMNHRNKGLLRIHNSQLIALCIDKLQKYHRNILINANQNVEEYKKYNFPVIEDNNSDYQGPISGLLSCRAHIKTPLTLVVPVDAPLFPEDYSKRMLDAYRKHAGICVAHDGNRLQYLFLLFESRLFADMAHYFEQGERSVRHWLQRHTCHAVDFSDVAHAFYNINTPEDLAHIGKLKPSNNKAPIAGFIELNRLTNQTISNIQEDEGDL